MGRGWCNWCCCSRRYDTNSKIPNKTLKEENDDDDDENVDDDDGDFYKVRYDNATVKLLKTNNLPESDLQLQQRVSNAEIEVEAEAEAEAEADAAQILRQTLKNEIEQSLAASISDRATDQVLEALTRYRRGLGIADSPSILLDEPQTPDIVRSRSSHDADGLIIRPGRGSILPKMGLESPTATPHMTSKRRSVARKVRPQSVVENLSLGHIPDLLESPSSHRSSSQLSQRDSNGTTTSVAGTTTGDSGNALDDLGCGGAGGDDECGDSITELPSASFQLQHLVKGRPKRAKTRAPTRPLVAVDNSAGPSTKEIGEGLDVFFRPGSVTPTTLTPLISPTSEECSSLSFVDSPTMSRDGNGQFTSEETTPILEERRPIKLDRQSPLLKGAPWTTRSRSTDNLEKYSPLIGRKSPLVKMRTESTGHGNGAVTAGGDNDTNSVLKAPERENKIRSPSSDSIRSHTGGDGISVKTTNGIIRTPIILQKPRPWSVVGNEPKAPGTNNDFQNSDSSKTTPEKLDEDPESLPFSQSSNNVGVVPGPALEKKSVRELAAGLNRLDLPMKPQVLPRTLLTSASAISKSASTSHITGTNSSSTSTTTTITALLQTQRLKITNNSLTTTTTTNNSNSSATASKGATTTTSTSTAATTTTNDNENNETLLTKTVIMENGNGNGSCISSSSFIKNEIINIRNGGDNITNDNSDTTTTATTITNNERNNISNFGGISVGGLKRIAGKEISTLFEETLVEGLQRSSTRRIFRDTQYTKEDVVDL